LGRRWRPALACALWLCAPAARGLDPGDVLVADFPAAPQPSALVRFSAGGQPLGVFADTADGIAAPRDLALDGAGSVYVADNASVLAFDGQGTALPPLVTGLDKAMSLAFDAGGDLFVSNRLAGGTSEIRRYSPAGVLQQTWPIPEFDNGGPEPFAREIAFGPDGLLYLALRGSNSSSNDNLVATLDPQTGSFSAFADAADQVTQPIGLAFEPAGTLLVVNDTGTQQSQASRIVRLSAGGTFLAEFWGQDAVRDLFFDGFGQLHGANRTGGVVLWDSGGGFDREYGVASLLEPIALALWPVAGPFCSNGLLEAGEGCDDGNRDPCDGCSAVCQVEFGCGDGSTCGAEACDDGNAASCDGCSPACALEVCGDGLLCPGLGEECDDANTSACDGCSPVCTTEVCGNGRLDCGEQCDDGNSASCDGCTSCQVDELAYRDDFEGGSPGWVANGLWNADDFRSVSPDTAWYYGQTFLRNYQTVLPSTNSGALISPSIDLAGIAGVELSFQYFLETEAQPGVDLASVEISRDGFGSDVTVLAPQLPERSSFGEQRYDLSAFAGDLVQLRFGFDTVDGEDNHFEGFYVDDAMIVVAGAPVCGNGLAAASCGETCDDGNTEGGDGCSATCQLEGVTDQREFAGTAQGGAIAITVSSVALGVPTSAGESSAAVAAAVAAAIAADPTLQALGVSAASSGGTLFVIGGSVDDATSSDPGIQILGPPTVPALGGSAALALALLLAAGAARAGRRGAASRSRRSPRGPETPARRRAAARTSGRRAVPGSRGSTV
jgi:cysteine-rich repeat protein